MRVAATAVAFDQTRWATPAVITGRVDLTEAAVTVQQAMIAGAELTGAYRGVVQQQPHLTGSARTLLAWTRDDSVEMAARTGHETDKEAATVSPWAVHANRAVAIPDRVRHELLDGAQHVIDVSDSAMSANNALTGVVQQQLNQSSGCVLCRPEEKDRSSRLADRLPTVSR